MRPVVLLVFIVPGAMAAPFLHAVVPDLPGSGSGDEGFAVDADGVDLEGYQVTDGEGTWTLPSCTTVCWYTGNPGLWDAADGPPAKEWNATDLRLANDGDNLELMDPDGDMVDAVAWGPGTDLRYRSPGVMYVQGSDDWVTPRIHRIGESTLDRPTFEVGHLTLYTSPDSSFQVLSGLIDGATDRLRLHVYDFDHPALLDALVQAKADHADLDLSVLVDGRVVGQSDDEQADAEGQWARITDVGGAVVLADGGRYAHHHLKVLVADDSVAIQSENWNPTGVPEGPTHGNRGWGVVVHDTAFADWMSHWMQEDEDAWDVILLDRGADPPAPYLPPGRGTHIPVPAMELHGTFTVTPVISPDHTADPSHDPVLAAMQDASTRIWGQQLRMTEMESNALGWETSDRFVDALGAAATGGIDVRLHLAAPFAYDDVENTRIAAALQETGAHAMVWDHPDLGTLHNKGWLMDDTVYVGSMNGNHASRSANREVGVLLEGDGIADWYGARFLEDDAAMRALPIPATPVPMLLATMAVVRACRKS